MSAPAVFRAPLSDGEFYAQWPQHATAQDLEAIKVMFVIVMDQWAKHAKQHADHIEAAELEYASWLARAADAGGKEGHE